MLRHKIKNTAPQIQEQLNAPKASCNSNIEDRLIQAFSLNEPTEHDAIETDNDFSQCKSEVLNEDGKTPEELRASTNIANARLYDAQNNLKSTFVRRAAVNKQAGPWKRPSVTIARAIVDIQKRKAVAARMRLAKFNQV